MHFAVQKELLVKALKDVGSAVASRVIQPILSNVLVETEDETTLRFQATDLDLAIETHCPAVVYTQGAVTLPGKKMLEIVSRLPDDLVSFQVNKETSETTITCKRSRFSLAGLPAEDFPSLTDSGSVDGVVMPSDILRTAIMQTSFAAAGYDTANILGGVYLVLEEGVFEATATDGSRLAHRRQELKVNAGGLRREEGEKEVELKAKTATLEKPLSLKAIVPARACSELLKLIDTKDVVDVRIALSDGQILFETATHFLSSRLIGGEYPRYHELFPSECKYMARLNRQQASDAISRVAVMSDERTHLIKLHFEPDAVQISANTPDIGRAQEELSIYFEGQVIDVALNVRYVLDVLQRLSTDEVVLEMTGPLKPLIFKGAGDENYRYLLMPVQAKG